MPGDWQENGSDRQGSERGLREVLGVLDIDYAAGITNICLCQNLPLSIQDMSVLHANYTSIKLNSIRRL